MTQRVRATKNDLFIILAFGALTSCAVPTRQTVEASQPASVGQMALGVVASIRPMCIAGAQSGAMAGVSAVLSALSQQPMAAPLTGEEVVIRRNDGNTAVVVNQDQIPGLAAGDRVALIASDPAVIIRRN